MSQFQPTPTFMERINRLPPEALERRYARWPYFLPPYGWRVDPNLAPEQGLDWTCVVPRDPAAYNTLIEEIRSKRASQHKLWPIPQYTPTMGTPAKETSEIDDIVTADGDDEKPTTTVLRPAPLFARIPPSGRTDPHFIAYRFAQRQWPADPNNPLIHPAFQYYDSIETPDLTWDLSISPVDFPAIARSAIIPLFPEEYLTPLTHPPLAFMRVSLDALPGLFILLEHDGHGPLAMEDVMEKMVAGLGSRLTVGEWNSMREEERRRVIRGYEKRAKKKCRYKSMELIGGEENSETRFLVRDVLGDNIMFLGLASEPNHPQDWILYTTSKDACRYSRSRSSTY